MSPRTRSILAFILVTLIWGSTWSVIKDQISTVPAQWSVTWRFALAALGMVLLAKWRGEDLRLGPGGYRFAAMLGLLQFCLNFQFVYQAQHHLTSGVVAVLFALLMVPNAVFAKLFLGNQVSGRFVVGGAVAIAGIGLLLAHEYEVALPGGSVLLGVLLAGAAITCASGANVMQASETARRQPALSLIAWAMIFGTLFDATLATVMTGPPVFDPRPEYWWGIAYLGILGSVVTFPLYFALIRDWGPGPAAYNGVAVPVVAMTLSTVLEGYHWTPLAVGGALLAMAGLLIALSGRKAVQ
jgi:drug/metabolite transporter (DMT)-like permease